MTGTHSWMTILLMSVVIVGCKGRNHPAEETSSASGSLPASTSAPAASNDATDNWLGKWIGPEGTYLVLAKNGGKYVVQINSLDGPANYEGTPNGERIEFQRNGKMESIHAGNGHDTGMKWLLDKKNCLIIQSGEGFCRD